ncbi:DUF4349 domain-containing protein [Antrihabitans cavernicola]|uniref:DUF4349 domain-containing protein n=2 Tax=Antrihabitans cavernicola TaxID=2495913 RepID=A0A5A7SCA6_9NOCA|nr:DUF4349 domain-containing protein [Spelaeibacter cavernicola]
MLATIVAVFAVTLIGCDSDSGPSAGGSAPAVAVAPGSPMSEAASPAPKSFQSDSRTQAPDQADRKEVVTGSVNVTASDPIDAAHKATTKVESLQGRVDDRNEQPGTDNTTPSSSLTVRVPADKTDQFIDDLRDIGKVTSVSLSKNDVTMQVDDLDARIKALQTSVDRLRALIASATNTADLIEAEKAVSDRQGELDSLTSQQRRLDDQIDLSTLTIQFTTEDATPSSSPDNFWDGIVSGWHSLISWIGGAIVWIGSALPWIAFLAIIGGVVWLSLRVIRRRRS